MSMAIGVFLQILDKYTTLGVYVIHHSFTLAELFALSGLQFTSNTIQTGLKAAEESVQVIDGIFGSNETSRAIASIITLVHHELVNDPEFELAKSGKMAVLGGLTKAMTAFAVLQNVTHKRTMEFVKVTKMWKGLVVEEDHEDDDENNNASVAAALVRYQNGGGGPTATGGSSGGDDENATDVIHELEEILAHNDPDSSSSTLSLALQEGGSASHWASAYPMYEISTATKRTITRTTRIRPIAPPGQPQPQAKYIVVKSDEEDNESFMAVIDHEGEPIPGAWIEHRLEDDDDDYGNYKNNHNNRTLLKSPSKGLKIMLSAVSKKFSRKKAERQVKYSRDDHHHQQQQQRDMVGRSFVHHGSIETLDLLEDNEDDDDDHDNSTTLSTTRSATLRSTTQYTTAADEKPLPLPPPSQQRQAATSSLTQETMDPAASSGNSDRTIKRKSSWGRMKLKGARRKSVSSLFQKGAEVLNANRKKQPSPPPLPIPSSSSSRHLNTSSVAMASRSSVTSTTHRGRSNSMTSVSSISHTLTATYTTAPSSPSSSTMFRSSQQQQQQDHRRQQQQQYRPDRSERRTKSIVRSPSAPSNRKKRKYRSPLDKEPDPRNFPRKHIINNIAHFMRYASAAYGEAFMRILRIGDIPSVLPSSHHPNHHAFSHHTGVAVDDILLSSYTDAIPLSGSVQHPQLHALVHYVTVDHSAEAIVLTCRGTLGLSDVLTDLMCDYSEFSLPTSPYTKFKAHGGMLEAAQLLAKQKGKVYQAILEGLGKHPSYGLVLCGHSLGAGVAALLSVLWSQERHTASTQQQQGSSGNNHIAMAALARDPVPFITSQHSGLPPGRPIHCYTYGPPSTMSLELSEYCGRGLVTSVVHGYDIVPCLSLGLLRDFKNVAVSLYQEASVADDILRRVIGRRQSSSAAAATNNNTCENNTSKGGAKQDDEPREEHDDDDDDDENDQWYWALIKTMRADMREDKLYPPSTIYLVESTAQLTDDPFLAATTTKTRSNSSSNSSSKKKKKHAHMVVLNRCEDVQARFSEIMFARSMFMDHSPNMYENAIRQLCRGFFGQQGAYERV
ncbi:hypothetical protein BDB00DRAFT_202752 [Zychaea mexicana]|uniref:uncharacterized protein n=1 Tax=Zychaea mexicana TaxID=64656 RepID=UPI0022FF0930|nr:uncharacterized protein BDB00DRAFT_202752 [Zychaea mexicana]KAI9474859.1 hypothetical protein BDB00DRAFT_202752 [Zychaea mexicana]